MGREHSNRNIQEPLVLADIPLNTLNMDFMADETGGPGRQILREAESVARMTDEDREEFVEPVVAVPHFGVTGLVVEFGQVEVAGLKLRGEQTIQAHVPESVALAIQNGSFTAVTASQWGSSLRQRRRLAKTSPTLGLFELLGLTRTTGQPIRTIVHAANETEARTKAADMLVTHTFPVAVEAVKDWPILKNILRELEFNQPLGLRIPWLNDEAKALVAATIEPQVNLASRLCYVGSILLILLAFILRWPMLWTGLFVFINGFIAHRITWAIGHGIYYPNLGLSRARKVLLGFVFVDSAWIAAYSAGFVMLFIAGVQAGWHALFG